MVSSVTLVEANALSVVTEVANGHKCERCWNIVPSVNEMHVCPRCEAVLKGE
jgi:isoleucyl-tRNA synthetase